MKWSLSERIELRDIIAQLDNFHGLRSSSPPKNTLQLRYSDAEELKNDLASSSGGALLVRHLLRVLGFDERRLLRLRLEHKLLQAHVLQHYCPGVIPVTVGVTRELSGLSRDAAEKRITHVYKDGFCLKPTLGAGGSALPTIIRPNGSAAFGLDLLPLKECSLLDEQFIFQEQVDIAEEYRVHSIEDSVIPGLTYLRHTPHSTDVRSTGKPESFVQEVLNALPSGMTRDSLCGWDIAIDCNGKPFVIEVNYSGMHSVYRPGFQCSGFFHTRPLAVQCLARLIDFMGSMYGVELEIESPPRSLDKYSHIYWLVHIYRSFGNAISDVEMRGGKDQQPNHLSYLFSKQLSYEENLILWALAEVRGVSFSIHRQDELVPTSQSLIPLAGLPELSLNHPTAHIECIAPIFTQQEDNRFFRQMLQDIVEPTDPFNLLSVSTQAVSLEVASLQLAPPLVARLSELARKYCVDRATLFHLAWGVVVARTSSRSDVVFATVFYGCLHRRYFGDSKPFFNALPIRLRIDETTIVQSAQATHVLLDDLVRHQQASMSLAHRCSGLTSHIPLSGALLNYRTQSAQTDIDSKDKSGILQAPPLYPGNKEFYPLSLVVDDGEEGITLTTHAMPDVGALHICELTQTTLNSLADLLEAYPDTPVSHLEPLSAPEREQLLYGWNQTQMPIPVDQSVCSLFEAQVRNSPKAIALEYPGGELTYSQLNSCANCLARRLRDIGIDINSRIAIYLDRGPEMVIALLAVLKAGGTYIPLDPTYPIQRIKFMLEDSAPAVLLTNQHLRELLIGLGESLLLLNVNFTELIRSEQHSDQNLPPTPESIFPAAQRLAYTIYTSGSTGTPKGVQVSHSSLLNLLLFMQHELGIGTDDKFLALTTISFDIAALEVFLPLISGARVRLVDRESARNGAHLIHEIEGGTTFVQATPTTWKMLLEAGWQGKPDLKVICGGEPLDVELARKLVLRCESAWNMYGPTETTIWSLFHKLEKSLYHVVIGRPIANTQVYVLDHTRNLSPIGVQGELYIGGAGVSAGYLNQPELTAQRFGPNTFLPNPNSRIYRTGDLARWLPDGTVEFLGRNDSQVKIHGFRIELGEIEVRLKEHPAVLDAVVLVREDTPGTKRLVAYFTPANAVHTDANALRIHLSRVLPDYMLPVFYIQLDSLPSTPNGKLDRAALPVPDHQITTRRAPRTSHEEILCSLFAEMLDIESVGIDDDFFDLGGNSLLAIRLLGRIHTVTGIDMSIDTFFANPTVAQLVESFNAFSVSLLLDPSATDSWL